MATYTGPAPDTFIAGEDMSADRYKVVKIITADNTVGKSANQDAMPIGVCVHPAASGKQVGIQTRGIAKCIASAAITRGNPVAATTAGKIATYTSTAGTDFYLGTALESASANNDIISVLLSPGADTGTT
jgi:hypothetical protein